MGIACRLDKEDARTFLIRKEKAMVRQQAPADETPESQSSNGSAKEISIIPLEATEESASKVELSGKVALIVGGATENGQALAVAFADRGIDIALVYFNSAHELAVDILEQIEQRGQRCLLIPGQALDGEVERGFAREAMVQIIDAFGRLDIFINFSAHDFPLGRLVKPEQKTAESVRSRIFPHFNMMKAALEEIIAR
jgi:hypothetical protein